MWGKAFIVKGRCWKVALEQHATHIMQKPSKWKNQVKGGGTQQQNQKF
jgi:hypothetical protein